MLNLIKKKHELSNYVNLCSFFAKGFQHGEILWNSNESCVIHMDSRNCIQFYALFDVDKYANKNIEISTLLALSFFCQEKLSTFFAYLSSSLCSTVYNFSLFRFFTGNIKIFAYGIYDRRCDFLLIFFPFQISCFGRIRQETAFDQYHMLIDISKQINIVFGHYCPICPFPQGFP